MPQSLSRPLAARLMGPLLLLLLLAQCTPKGTETAPALPQLVAKYRVLDEHLSPGHVSCSGTVREFLAAGPSACSFRVGGMEFDIQDKFAVDATGHLRAYWSYHSEGPVEYSLADLRQDEFLAQQVGIGTFRVAWLPGGALLDGGDTLVVETRYPAEKLLLAKRTAHTPVGHRVLYQYQ
jgi:hypothetical protein